MKVLPYYDVYSKRLSFFCMFSVMALVLMIPLDASAESIQISGTIDSTQVKQGEDILVTITIVNPTDFKYKGFDLQLTQTGFSKIEGKTWPSEIEPNSSIMGTITLEAKKKGMHEIGYIVSYNLTKDGVAKQDFINEQIGTVYVSELAVKISEQIWSAITVIIAGVIGALITGIASYIQKVRDENKQEEKDAAATKAKNEKDFKRTKSLLQSELGRNKRKIEGKIPCVFANWGIIQQEGLYPILAKNTVLEDKVGGLYVELEIFNRMTSGNITEEKRSELVAKITEILELLNSWESN